MPIYNFHCKSCEKVFETIKKLSDPPVELCPTCGIECPKVMAQTAPPKFVGRGFYINDYPKRRR